MMRAQREDWETNYNWHDRWYYSYEDVVTIKLPPKPKQPTFPTKSSYPAGDEIEWIHGGAGQPQSGEIDISSAYARTSKHFGVMGQTSESGSQAVTLELDGSQCHARYYALNVQVVDGAGITPEDVLEMTVSLQRSASTVEFELVEIPSIIPSLLLKDDPEKNLLEEMASNVKLQVGVMLTYLLSIYTFTN